jgi:hypothetical protein
VAVPCRRPVGEARRRGALRRVGGGPQPVRRPVVRVGDRPAAASVETALAVPGVPSVAGPRRQARAPYRRRVRPVAGPGRVQTRAGWVPAFVLPPRAPAACPRTRAAPRSVWAAH